MRFALRYISILVLAAASLFACSLVDEDMRDCETDYNLDYELRLVTNISTEIHTELNMNTDVYIAQALEAYLKTVFTDYAHDVDLGFYDVVRDEAAGDSLRLHHEAHIMDANQSSYTLYIPIRRYMHLAVANIEDNGLVTLENGGLCHAAKLSQMIRDSIGCHRSGLFTARQQMNIKEGQDQQFNVNLYMANCASSIIIDTTGSGVRDLRVVATGFATEFNICDSTYQFQYTPIVKSDKIDLTEPGRLCYVTINFPSRALEVKSTIDSDDPFVSAESAEGSLWRYKVYTRMGDNKVNETVLGVFTPLKPGQFKIIKVKVLPNGAVQPDDPTIGVSITMDWSPGLDHEVHM